MIQSTQFSNSKLVIAYDSLNSLGDDSEFMCQLMSKIGAKSIIDLGCGTGLLTCELAKRGYDMIGIEPASAMLAVARNKPCAEKVEWIEGGYEKFEGLNVDTVLMTSHVAQFFLDGNEWQAMLKAAHQVLKPGGHIVFDSRPPIFPPYQTWPTTNSPKRVTDPNLGPIDWWYKLLEIKDSHVHYQLHYHFINSDETIVSTDELIFRSQDELTRSLSEAGFRVEIIYGDWDGSTFTPASPEMIFVAVRV